MGCGAGKKIIQESRPVLERNKFHLSVEVPTKGSADFKYDTDYEEMPLSTLMNFLLFDPAQSSAFNANFISIYSNELKRYQYFIERLVGIQIDSEENPYKGKQWVVYLNDIKYEWDSVCEKDAIVRPMDNIRFQFEVVSK